MKFKKAISFKINQLEVRQEQEQNFLNLNLSISMSNIVPF